MEKKRYTNIDLLKTIAIIMVIALHSHLLNTDFISNPQISVFIQYGIRIICEGVAIFILVNGFLIINKKEFELKKHLIKTLKIFFILILWSFILTISIKLIYHEQLNLLDIIKNVFTTDINNQYTGILWFLQNLIALYLIYPVLKILHDKEKKIYNYIFIILCISTLAVNLLRLISDLINTKLDFNGINILTTYIGKFQILTNRNFLIFFMIGGYLFEYKEKFEDKKFRNKWALIGLFAWVISYIFAIVVSKLQNKTYTDSFNYESIFMPFILIGIFAITYNYKDSNKWYNKIITTVGKNSMGIYLLHIIVIRVINAIFIVEVSLVWRVLKVLIIFIISLILTLVIKKIPRLNKIIEI